MMLFCTCSIFAQPSNCTFTFSDTGGITGNYMPGENNITVYCPDTFSNVVTMTFTEFDLEAFNDGMYVYDGNNINPDHLISSGNPASSSATNLAGAFWGNNIPGPFTSTAPDGCLTFVFKSNNANQLAGWVANTTCGPAQSGFNLNAFLDENNNGTRDNNEFLFPYGDFTYQKNGGAVNYTWSNNGTSQVLENSVVNNYSFNFIPFSSPFIYNNYYTFPTTGYTNQNIGTSPNFVTLDFPVTSTALYNDLGIYLHHFGAPRAGFNYTTRLTYTNYSNQTISNGVVTFNKNSYNNIVATSVLVTNTSSGFEYNFVNMLPFETRNIDFTLSVPNIPAVTIGQSSNLTATIATTVPEITLLNNSHTYNCNIVASYDPNDIAESHGQKILYSSFAPDEDLIYTIRFENTGNAPAETVKIVNVLDAQIDETSIAIVGSSVKSQLTRVGNNLTFMFNEINLPPSVANTQIGHCFVTYKAKLKTGFSVGTVVPNAAKIYFDTNPAIDTNVFNTEFVSSLSNADFVNNNDLKLYPNPVSNILIIESVNKINKIAVFDLMGRLLKTTNSENTIDISDLMSGNYIVKAFINENIITSKIIKE